MITWIRNKAIKLFAIISYPRNLVPKGGFRKEIQIADLVTEGPIGIVRRSLKSSKAETFDKFGTVREDALIGHRREIPELSLNLLGGRFILSHICYSCVKDAAKYWDGIETHLWIRYFKWVTYKKPSIPIFFFLDDLHNKTFPYYRTDDKEVRKLLKSLQIDPEITGSQAKFYGASIIKHAPSRLNYWHIEFRLLDIEARIKGTPSVIVRDKIRSYKDLSIAMDLTKQHWINQAANHALNDILLTSAYDFIKEEDYKKIDLRFILN